jgi:hypothetical protein
LAARNVLTGAAIGATTYGIALLCTIALAPRSEENVRQSVALPWLMYAMLPSFGSTAAGILFSAILSRRDGRLIVLLATVLTILACSAFGIDLLRRDFIGKL